uniref:NADH-ubiquinone oxidoreductase chain 4L n=1 Tax=Thaumatoptyx cf. diacoptyx RM-2016 TaxID=1885852 RepID=A0A224ACI1_9EUPU|nr:NADH dehydrogenase subunit 4L [Thaumatoptyx cf. diacoptyx RM-2016]
MMKFLYMFFLLLLILYLYIFSVQNHFLSILIILEAMLLILLSFSLGFSMTLMEGYSVYLWILTLSVCEAAIGLTLLISYMKLNGSDLVSNKS